MYKMIKHIYPIHQAQRPIMTHLRIAIGGFVLTCEEIACAVKFVNFEDSSLDVIFYIRS
jgi:hypothetical protein